MLTPFLFLAGFMIIITTPGLIAMHIEDKRAVKAGQNMEKVS